MELEPGITRDRFRASVLATLRIYADSDSLWTKEGLLFLGMAQP